MRFLVVASALFWASLASAGLSYEERDARSRNPNRVVLGETFLENRPDGDYVAIRPVCNLTMVQLGVLGDAAEIRDLRVVFGNNQVQDIAVREQFQANSFSVWKDLDGNARCVKGFYVFGRSNSNTPRSSRVVLYGYEGGSRTKVLAHTELSNRPGFDIVRLPRPVCDLHRFAITVVQNAARIDFLMVEFGNGQRQQFEVRDHFAPGSSSRWMDLNGNARCVTTLYVSGKTENNWGRSAVVQFLGLSL